jgi:hypothetical protein
MSETDASFYPLRENTDFAASSTLTFVSAFANRDILRRTSAITAYEF